MRKFLLYLLLLAAAVSATSCRRAVEKVQRNIRFEGIEKIERQGLTGAEMVVRVMNNTGYKLQLRHGRDRHLLCRRSCGDDRAARAGRGAATHDG